MLNIHNRFIVRVRNIIFDCDDPYPLVEFWTRVTGFQEDPQNKNEPDDPEGLLVGPDGGLNLLFIKTPEGEPSHRLLLDLAPGDRSLDDEVDRLIKMGATLVADHRHADPGADGGGGDGEGWVVLADPEGNEFTVARRLTEPVTAPSAAVAAEATPTVQPAGSDGLLARLGFRSTPRNHRQARSESGLARYFRRFEHELRARLGQLIRLVLLVLEGLIAVRVILKVAGANEHAGFANFLYKITAPLVAPFHPVFADGSINGHPFEVGSLLAMGVYAAAAYIAARLLRLFFSSR